MGRAGEKLEVSVEEKDVVVVERKAVRNMAILVLCVVVDLVLAVEDMDLVRVV